MFARQTVSSFHRSAKARCLHRGIGLSRGLLEASDDLGTAAYIGNAAAAVEASMLGNQPVDATRLHAWLKDRHELIVEAAKSKRDILPTPTPPVTATEPIGSSPRSPR